jgi:hypothetical protein
VLKAVDEVGVLPSSLLIQPTNKKRRHAPQDQRCTTEDENENYQGS